MTDKILVDDKWYVSATAARSEESPQVLKSNETFAMFDRFGDIHGWGTGEQGLYREDTRFLSQQELLIDGVRPMYLKSTVKEDSSQLLVELMNPDLPHRDDSGEAILKGSVHLFRGKLLWDDACHEHLRVTNHSLAAVSIELTFRFEADYADIFEVRGMQRAHRGRVLPAEIHGNDCMLFRYLGRDDRERCTRISLRPAPASLTTGQAVFAVTLEPGQEAHVYCTIACEVDEAASERLSYESAYQHNKDARKAALDDCCRVSTSNPFMNLWLDRSVADLSMLTSDLPTGRYPYAGVPWYSTTFGRDGILTAREYLWVDPTLARGVLAFLASTQATKLERERDAEPGKILHEARRCEMAATGEVPFGRYYGTVDATPLFVGLASAYHRRTGDIDFIRGIWPNIIAALDWIDNFGDSDGDGFVEYARSSEDGLVQQGWKDSQDSVFHADGRMAEAPIALCEVQAYVYEAKLGASELSALLGYNALSERLASQAEELKRAFQQRFWCEDLGSYAIALDGNKQPCRVRSSNVGHALWTGIASPEHARAISLSMLGKPFFSGFGIRTIAAGEARYNPMSYHNGSIWPHDNALIAAGMARYGHTEQAMQVLAGLFEASVDFSQHRLPELFCGFPRRPGEGPTLYPVACSPQAWASAAVFGMLEACLGLHFDASAKEISFVAPRLPDFIDSVQVRGLGLADASVDLIMQRYARSVGIEVTGKTGDISVRILV